MQFKWSLFVIVLAMSFVVRATNLDCHLPKSMLEKKICADKQLNQLYKEINSRYNKLNSTIGAAYQPRFQHIQHTWLKQLATSTDLNTTMQHRLEELNNTFVTINSLRFLQLAGTLRPPYLLTQLPGTNAYNLWVDQIWKETALDESNKERMDNCNARYADLMQNHSEKEPDFIQNQNALEKKCNNVSFTFRQVEIDFSSPDLLSIHEAKSENIWHAAHPSNSDAHYNWWLYKSGQIKKEDIFIKKEYVEIIQHKILQQFANSPEFSIDKIPGSAFDPINWALTSTQFRITGQGYEYHQGRGFEQINIPWREFKGSVNPDLLTMLQKVSPSTDSHLKKPL